MPAKAGMTLFPINPLESMAILFPSFNNLPFPMAIFSKGLFQSTMTPRPLGYRIAIG
ncbi:hypothetical protein D3C72_813900 [compost metagenome]